MGVLPQQPGAVERARLEEERPFRRDCCPDHQRLLEAGREPWEPQERKAWEVTAATCRPSLPSVPAKARAAGVVSSHQEGRLCSDFLIFPGEQGW